jgi:hypothetical protein
MNKENLIGFLTLCFGILAIISKYLEFNSLKWGFFVVMCVFGFFLLCMVWPEQKKEDGGKYGGYRLNKSRPNPTPTPPKKNKRV